MEGCRNIGKNSETEQQQQQQTKETDSLLWEWSRKNCAQFDSIDFLTYNYRWSIECTTVNFTKVREKRSAHIAHPIHNTPKIANASCSSLTRIPSIRLFHFSFPSRSTTKRQTSSKWLTLIEEWMPARANEQHNERETSQIENNELKNIGKRLSWQQKGHDKTL